MQNYYTICVLLIVGIPFISSLANNDELRNQKLISSFQIVRFPNDACVGSGDRNGTCYTSQECTDKGGTSSGSCADGFGVCCTFVITNCGSTSSENMTSWTTPTTLPDEATSCTLNVCPPNADICSLRLDFVAFQITGPSTVSVGTVRRRLGTPVGNNQDAGMAIEASSYATNCMLDVFSATSASPSTNPASVCGLLTGEHMYLEADVDRCNVLDFNLAATGGVLPAALQTNNRGVANLATRNWDIMVTQIECSSVLLPPAGCTKYYFNQFGLATLTSYNFAGNTVHLANQHERMCIRRERGNCVGCFSAAAVENVAISGLQDTPSVYTQAGGCCGYHTMTDTGVSGVTAANVGAVGQATAAGTTQMGFDCLIIPGAFISVGNADGQPAALTAAAVINEANTLAALRNRMVTPANTGNVPAPPHICGNNAGLGIGAATLLAAANDNGEPAGQMTGGGNAANTNLSICTRNVPFTLEFLSDDLDGLGSIAGDYETSTDNTANRGFQIEHTQVSCST